MKIIFTSNVIFEKSRHEVGESLDVSKEQAAILLENKVAQIVEEVQPQSISEYESKESPKPSKKKKAGRK